MVVCRLLHGQRQKISDDHSCLGFQMDSDPLPVLEKSHALRREQIHGDLQEKRFDFRHLSPGAKTLKSLWTGTLRRLFSGSPSGTHSSSCCSKTDLLPPTDCSVSLVASCCPCDLGSFPWFAWFY